MRSRLVVITGMSILLFQTSCKTTDQTPESAALQSEATPTDTAPSQEYYWVDDKVRALLVDSVPIDVPPRQNYLEDYGGRTPPPGLTATQWDTRRFEILESALKPSEYERNIVIPRINGGASGPKRNLFAAKTVLEAMRRLRRLFATNPIRTPAPKKYLEIPGGRGISPEEYDKLSVKGTDGIILDTPPSKIQANWLASLNDREFLNYNVLPPVWNDLQNHFYPLLPHRTHGCWTKLFWAMVDSIETCGPAFVDANNQPKFAGKGVSLRQHFLNICTGIDEYMPKQEELKACGASRSGRAGRDSNYPDLISGAIGAIPGQMYAYNQLWVDPKTGAFIDPPSELALETGEGVLTPVKDGDFVNPDRVGELKSIKWAKQQRSRGLVNVFDYVMMAQYWAFDWEQTHAVLTAFYGELKTAKNVLMEFTEGSEERKVVEIRNSDYGGPSGNEKNLFDPNDPGDCHKYRPRLGNDAKDGTHCRIDKSWKHAPAAGVSGGR